MIKYYKYLISIFLLLAFSCEKNDLDLNENGNKIQETKKLSRYHDKYNFLGCGYDITGDYAENSSAKISIIDMDKLIATSTSLVDITPWYSHEAVEAYGENAMNYSKNLTSKLNSPIGEYSAFGKKIKLGFTDEITVNEKYDGKNVYGSYTYIWKNQQLRLTSLGTLKNYLTEEFKDNINLLSPSQIVSIYGTHLLTDIILGAKLELIYRSETTSSDRTTSAKVGISIGLGKFNLTNDVSTDKSIHKQSYNSVLNFRTRGGDNTLAFIGTLNLNAENSVKDISPWVNSIKPINWTLVNFGDQYMVPIYELVDNQIKAEALRKYIDSYITSRNVKVADYTQPIFRYYNTSSKDHFYTRTAYQYPGHSYEGIEFYTYTYAVPNAVPIYRFYGRRDHYYTTDPGAPSGYVAEGIEFYAFTTQLTGTVPIHRYYNSGSADHFYTKTLGSFSGYKYEGIAFYAYPGPQQPSPEPGPSNSTL